MIKPKLIMTVGAPASGKTTWAVKFCEENTNYVNLNRDELRKIIQVGGSYKYSKQREKLVTELQLSMATVAVLSGKGVVISDTNLNEKTRSTWEKFAKDNDYLVQYKVFDELPHVLLKRNLQRLDSVPPEVILSMYKQMREFLGKPSYKEDTQGKLDTCIIVDIDGTLAHNTTGRSPYDYPSAINDTVDKHLLNLLMSEDANQIVILTGREADESGVSEVTVEWLKKNGIPYDEIYCRKQGDHRCDAIVKEELFFKHIAGRMNVDCVYDDRDQVVHMWRAIGLKCYQVAYGSF